MEVHVNAYEHEGERFTLVLIRDITQAKRSESVLRESNAFYRALFDDYPMPKLLIDPADGAIIQANQAASDFYGYSLDELRSLRIRDLNINPVPQIANDMGLAKT